MLFKNNLNKKDLLKLIDKLKEKDFDDLIEIDHKNGNMLDELYVVAKDYQEIFSRIIKSISEMKQKAEVVSDTYKDRINSNQRIMYANEDIASVAQQQAISAIECTDFSTEFEKKFLGLLEETEGLNEKCKETERISGLSIDSLEGFLKITSDSNDSFMKISNQLVTLENSLKNISSVVTTISAISKQTNLLSLNASIEAARAGEAGKGFSVVAMEVKKLAEESNEASKRISDEIYEIIEEMSKVVENVILEKDKINEQSKQIEEVRNAIHKISHSINGFIEGQSKIHHQVNEMNIENVHLLEKISEIAALTQESAATSQVVASASLEQANKDTMILDMINDLNKYTIEIADILKDFKIEQTSKERKKVGVICLEKQGFYEEIENACLNMGRILDFEVECRTPKRYNVEEQINIFNEFIEEGVTGIAIAPSDSKRLSPFINKAVEKGIYVICMDGDVTHSKRHSFVTSDSYEGGKLAGTVALRHLSDQGNILIFLAASEVDTVQERCNGFLEVVKQNSNINLLHIERQVDTDLGKSRELLISMLDCYPDFDLLYLVTGDSAEVAVDLWKERGIDKKLVVLSKSDKITDGVKSGIVSSQIVQRNVLWGEMALQMIDALIQGKEVKAFEDTGMYELNQQNYKIFEG